MRTILTFSVLLLAFCIGCPSAAPPAETPAPPQVDQVPADPVAEEVPPPAEPVVEATPPVEPVVEVTPPVEPVVEVTPPAAPVVEVATPVEPVVEVTPPAAPVVEVAAPAAPAATGAASSGNIPLPPLADLTLQVDEYIATIRRDLDSLDGSPNYVANAANVVRDASGLALVALAIGLADDDSQYKRAAPHIIAATRALTAAQNITEGRAAFAALEAALTNTSDAEPLSWSNKIADLGPVQRVLPHLSSTVNRLTDTPAKFNALAVPRNDAALARQRQVLAHLAGLAAVAQGGIPNVVQTEKPDAVDDWIRYSEEFRDHALKVNAAAHQFIQGRVAEENPDWQIYRTAFLAMTESCDNCHRAFYPSAVGQAE